MSRPAIHPGEVLVDELESIGVSPTELARQLAVPANRISQIIRRKRAITGDTALRLGHWFGMSPQFWLNLQVAYDVRIAEKLHGPKSESCRQEPSTPRRRCDRLAAAGLRGKKKPPIARRLLGGSVPFQAPNGPW